MMMVRRELKARHAGSVLGSGWVYAQPLLMLAAYYLLFDIVLRTRVGGDAPTRGMGTFLISGMLPWMAFTDALSRTMTSLIEAGALLQKNPLPPVLFPARSVTASAAIYFPLILLLVLAYAPYHHFALQMLALPVVMAVQVSLCFMLGYLLAVLVAAMRDIQQLAGFLLGIGMFMTPILFSFDMFPSAFRWVLWLNPMTPVVLSCQSLLLTGGLPPPQAWIAMAAWLTVAGLLLEAVLRRSREHLIDWL